MGLTYSSYFDFNNKKLYLLFEIVNCWVLCREFAKWIELVYVFVFITWLCQQGRSRFFLWIIWIFRTSASINNENGFCFPPDISNSINISRAFPSCAPFCKKLYPPIWPSSEGFCWHSIPIVFSSAQTCLRQMNQKSSVLWDTDCPGSFRSASKSLIQANTGFQPHPRLLPLWPWAGGLSQSQGSREQGGSSSQQQQWWALPNLLQARSARLV